MYLRSKVSKGSTFTFTMNAKFTPQNSVNDIEGILGKRLNPFMRLESADSPIINIVRNSCEIEEDKS